YQRLHPARLAHRIVEAAPAAHGLRDETHIPELQVVDQRRQVVDEPLDRWLPAGPRAREAEAALGEGDACVAVRECRHLLPPGELAAAEPMGEEQRRAGAVCLVVQVAAIERQEGHGGYPPGRELDRESRK